MFLTLFHPMFSTCMHPFLFLREYSMVLSILVLVFLTTVFPLLHLSIILCLQFLTLSHIRFFCHISLFVFLVIFQYLSWHSPVLPLNLSSHKFSSICFHFSSVIFSGISISSIGKVASLP